MTPDQERRFRELLGTPPMGLDDRNVKAMIGSQPPRQKIQEWWHGVNGIAFQEWTSPHGMRMVNIVVDHPDRDVFIPVSLVNLEQIGRAALDTVQKIREGWDGNPED